jgi:hypothetical protein
MKRGASESTSNLLYCRIAKIMFLDRSTVVNRAAVPSVGVLTGIPIGGTPEEKVDPGGIPSAKPDWVATVN